jgi:hypothetical protein
MVLGLGARAGNRWLFLSAPRDKIATKKDTKPRSRSPIFKTTGPIGITISEDIWRRIDVDLKAECEGTREITKDPFDGAPMIFSGLMHVLRNFVDRVSNVGSRKRGILKCTNDATIQLWIQTWWTICRGENCAGSHR